MSNDSFFSTLSHTATIEHSTAKTQHISLLNSQISSLEDDVRDLKKEIKKLKNELAGKDEVIGEWRAALEKWRAALEGRDKAIAAYQRALRLWFISHEGLRALVLTHGNQEGIDILANKEKRKAFRDKEEERLKQEIDKLIIREEYYDEEDPVLTTFKFKKPDPQSPSESG